MKATIAWLAISLTALLSSPVISFELLRAESEAGLIHIDRIVERTSSQPAVFLSTTWWECNDKELDYSEMVRRAPLRDREIVSTKPDLAAND